MFRKEFVLGVLFLVVGLVMILRGPEKLTGSLFNTSQPVVKVPNKEIERLMAEGKLVQAKIDSLGRLKDSTPETEVYNLANEEIKSLKRKRELIYNELFKKREGQKTTGRK